ncbi:MAG TPA: hypothetical protein PLH92_13425 [Mycobacterium sp.]|uniref:hypothetical protein n=1 Tax=Mycolicibacterium sp. TaxID=2320850 RepID=UPI0025FC4F21|nr:hypothetical protein [Mycolicibacterium sp.]HPX36978.1 hypothetical protein [Mycobacterium sp.]HQC77709.1 hypothetical protein [Mycobacterium sp.]
MFETTPPQSLPPESLPSESLPDLPADFDLSDLDDPTTGVVSVELSHLVVRKCLAWAEPLVSDLARQQGFLNKTGGPEITARVFAMRFFRAFDAEVFHQLKVCVPLTQMAVAQARAEDLLRGQFEDVVGTAISYLLSDGRDVAIQMTAVAATMAGNEVRDGMTALIDELRSDEVQG